VATITEAPSREELVGAFTSRLLTMRDAIHVAGSIWEKESEGLKEQAPIIRPIDDWEATIEAAKEWHWRPEAHWLLMGFTNDMLVSLKDMVRQVLELRIEAFAGLPADDQDLYEAVGGSDA
jgi:hypothetical protein